MNREKSNFRRWWRIPRRAGDPHTDRRVTFLELFYDLVYVVLISQLAHALSQDISLEGVGKFAFLFTLVWLAWVNGTLYHDVHGQNDLRTRIFTFLQMFTVASMAVFARNAIGEGSVGFALSYAAFMLILTYMWWRTGIHDPNHRPLSGPYSLIYLISTILFIASVFVPEPWRYFIWGFTLFLTLFVLPAVMILIGRKNSQAQKELAISLNYSPAAVERFGLFTIIVLGEVIVSVVVGVVELHNLNWYIGATAALGILIAIAMWWLYFDFVSHRIPKSKQIITFGWLYLHLPMTMGIAAAGAGILNALEHTDQFLPSHVRWLLVGATAVTLVSVGILMRTINVPEQQRRFYRSGSLVTIISGVVIALPGFLNLSTIPLLILVIIIMMIPVIYGIFVWIKYLNGEEIDIS